MIRMALNFLQIYRQLNCLITNKYDVEYRPELNSEAYLEFCCELLAP